MKGRETKFNNIEIGKRGEDEAVKFLENRGLLLRDRNWRFGRKELDIIMEERSFIHFIEVKTRITPALVSPLENINKKKRANILYAAANYLRINKIKKEAVFGVVTVEISGDTIINIEYYVNAFRSNW